MNKIKLIDKGKLSAWIEGIIKKYRVFAPQKIGENEYIFKDLVSPDKISLDYINPVISPIKDLLFPMNEKLIDYKKKENGWETKTEEIKEKTVLFGMRSCDLSALIFMDKFFLEGFKDNYYAARRENLFTVNVSCLNPAEYCFCVCADAGPSKDDGFDVQLTDIGGKYLVEIGSGKGEELVNIDSSLFTEASPDDLKKKHDLILEIRNNKFKLPTTYFSKAIRHVTADDISEKEWNKLGARCIACGSCSYICPTCTCFNVIDIEKKPGEGSRYRTWDSCMYGGFTREVSGHNPRPTQKERVKRRYYHKLSYYYLRKMGTHGCVGCGRCVISCLGSIDMFDVSKDIRRNG